MPKYLIKGNYVGQGVKALMKDGGTGRVKEIEALIGAGGGTVEAVYYALGDTDLYVIADVPDNETVAALSLTANSTGAVDVSVTALLTPEQMDEAGKKAIGIAQPAFE